MNMQHTARCVLRASSWRLLLGNAPDAVAQLLIEEA